MKVGYWSKHEYARRNLEDLEGFVGWASILSVANECLRSMYWSKSHPFLDLEWRLKERKRLRRRDQLLVSLLFLTGGRVSEVLMLRSSNFTLRGEFLYVNDMPLIKRKRILKEVDRLYEIPPKDEIKEYRWNSQEGCFIRYEKSESEIYTRQTFPIPMWEPLSAFVVESLSSMEEGLEWLFPSTGSRPPERQEDPGVEAWLRKFGLEHRTWISPARSWQIVTDISRRAGVTLGKKMMDVDGKEQEVNRGIWNHWWRSMRASQLSRDYRFDDPLLDRFFGWKGRRASSVMAQKYTGIQPWELVDRMERYRSDFEENYVKDLQREVNG